MILKEFDLDLPYHPNIDTINQLMKQCELKYSEAIKYDYEQNWKEKRRLFSNEVRCIASFYERVFGKLKTSIRCWKVLVECVEEITNSKPRLVGGVYEVEVQLNIDKYFSLTDYEKKKCILDMLFEGINKIIAVENWDKTLFQSAHDYIVRSNYINEWIWKRPLTSPTRAYKAEVICKHEVSGFIAYIVIRDRKSQEIKREMIFQTIPNEWVYHTYLGNLYWNSETEVVLKNKSGDENWSVSCS